MPSTWPKSDQKKSLRHADPEAVGKAMADRFAKPRDTWISDSNRYRKNFCGRVKSDVDTSKVNPRGIAEYIATSSPSHAIDGWAFLGRAIGCTLSRDTYSAVHFAYYAELRAGMAILAACGIGIGDKNHLVLQGNKKGNRSRPFRPVKLTTSLTMDKVYPPPRRKANKFPKKVWDKI